MRKLLAFVLIATMAGAAMAYDLGNRAPVKPESNIEYTGGDPNRQGGNTIFDAVPITIPGTYVGTTVGYTNNYDAVCPFTGSLSPDVVYVVTPGSNTIVDLDLCNSSYDTKIYVWNQDLVLIACNDDFHYSGSGCYVYSSKIESLALAGGQTYYIFVDGYGGAAGAYVLDVTEWTPPPPIECPTGSELENEPALVPNYSDAHNGGCNSPEHGNPFQPITQSVFCGVSGWYTADGLNNRDTDWFVIEIPDSGELIITGDAQYACYMFELGPQDCALVDVLQIVTIGPYNPATLTITGTPGSFAWVWVGPTEFTGPTNAFDYVLNLNIGDVATESHSWTSVKSLFN